MVAPNIQPLEPQTLNAYRQEDGVLIEGKIIERFNPWPSDSKNLGVLVLPFENRVPEGKQIGIANRVIGRIVLRSYDTRELKELSRVGMAIGTVSLRTFRPRRYAQTDRSRL